MKDVRSELAHIICEKRIYPKDRHREKIPPRCAQYARELIEKPVAVM
jgi:hypothetical protein